MALWWLSFCDPQKPKGTQFLGVAVVPGNDAGMEGAIQAAWRLGCNPGGEVQGFSCPSIVEPLVPHRYLGRLLTQEQADELDRAVQQARDEVGLTDEVLTLAMEKES